MDGGWAYEHRTAGRKQRHRTRSKGTRVSERVHLVQRVCLTHRVEIYCTKVNALASRDQAGAGGYTLEWRRYASMPTAT